MCISFLKHLFGKKEEPVIETGTTEMEEVVTSSTEVAETEGEIIEEPIITTMEKPYEGVNFHILLDNGHAKSTPGKRQKLESGRYFFEYEFNREVTKRIAERLDNLGISYEMLVPEVEKDIALSERASRANSFCSKYGTENCLFISVHSNACGDGITFNSAKGWSVWTTVGNTKSDPIATIFFNVADETLPKYGFTTRKQMSDGDPDYEENFTVIYKTKCPAILTENLFFTNKEEVAWLMSKEGKDVIADIHVEGIRRVIDGLK